MIFISYRKEDAGDLALSLADKLSGAFGEDSVFLDRYQIEPGDHWRENIDAALSKAAVVLAVIGPRWLATYDEFGQRRIDRDDDVLAYELSVSLVRHIRIIPLYVNGMKPLPAKAFPGRLAGLADQQGMEFDMVRDRNSLLTTLEHLPGLKLKSLTPGSNDAGEPSTRPRKPWCMPDSIGGLFKGRAEVLRELRDRILKDSAARANAAVPRQVIFGLGGIGKTRLAIEYAWQYEDCYSALLFAVADTPEQLRRSIAELTIPAILNLPEWKCPEEEIRVAAVFRWSSENPGWLLIIDNADDDRSVAAVQNLLASLRGGHVIITSRNSSWGGGKSVPKYELDVLPLEAAKTFLLERTNDERRKTPRDEIVALELARELGGLALALEQAGAYIQNRDGGLSFSDYLMRWREGRIQVLEWFNELIMHYPRSVAITWETTMRALKPGALTLFRILSWFAPDPIPRSLASSPDAFEIIKKAVQESGLKSEEIDPEQALSELIAYSMTKKIDEQGVACVALHRVVLKIMQERMTQEARGATVVAAAQLLVSFAPKDSYRPETWTDWRLLIPHAEAIWRVSETLPDQFWNIDLMKMFALYYLGQGRLEEGIPLQRKLLRLMQQRLQPDNPEIFTAKNDLALMLSDHSEEAQQLYREALAGREQFCSPESEDVGETLHNLGVSLRCTGNLEESETLLRRALSIFEKRSGPTHWRTLMAEYSLAMTLRAKGAIKEAQCLLESNVQKKELHLRRGHPDTLESVIALAEIYTEQGNKKAAAEIANRYMQALDSSGEFNSPLSLRKLALLFYVNGEYLRAEDLLRRALKADFQVPGNLCHLARILVVTDREEEARKAIAEAWQRRSLAPPYIVPRIIWFQLLFALLHHEDCGPAIGRLKSALEPDTAYSVWAMNPVLDYLKPLLLSETHSLLSKLVAAVSNPALLAELNSFELWRAQPPLPIESKIASLAPDTPTATERAASATLT
jgi:tetratricopeptide (TPR) repeat protein